MNIKLAENIRNFRKERSLTQEQLAEVLGVTPGAVYKWEAKLSYPELNLILEMASFFDTSVDALLGYEMPDNRLYATVQRLKDCLHDKDRAGLSEAEKALKKYPNNFDVVHKSAALYIVFGLESNEKALLFRALELLEKSFLLLSQNTDPKVSEVSLYGEMADVYMILGKRKEAVDLLIKHNAGGVYNGKIGFTMATSSHAKAKAIPFLSEALIDVITSVVHIVTGYVNIFFAKKDYNAARAILHWAIKIFSGLKYADKISFLDKINGVFFICLACAENRSGDGNAARAALQKALDLALAFDASPCYEVNNINFVEMRDCSSAYDDLGTTAMESLENTVTAFADEALSALWKEICSYEK